MKSRSTLLIRILPILCILPVFPLAAQDQTPSAPLQIQESPAPGSMPAPSLFAPEPTAASQSGTQSGTQPAKSDDAAPLAPATSDPVAPSANSGMGSAGQNPPPSDPNSLIPPPVESEQPSPINAAGNEEKQRQDQKTRYYTVKVKADKEESLVSLQQKADKARSDEAKRQALREYYDLLAKRMKKIDPSLSEWIDTMHAAYLRRLAQVRVEPTIPLNPPPVPDAEADTAAASKKGKSKATPSPSPSPAVDKKPEKKNSKPAPANA
jgi:hypothetical protein